MPGLPGALSWAETIAALRRQQPVFGAVELVGGNGTIVVSPDDPYRVLDDEEVLGEEHFYAMQCAWVRLPEAPEWLSVEHTCEGGGYEISPEHTYRYRGRQAVEAYMATLREWLQNNT